MSSRTLSHSQPRQVTTLWPFVIALAVLLLHCLTNQRYGFHRDELQFLTDARHLDWGFVAYPPLTPLIERFSMAVFGLWLPGLRLASVVAQSVAIVLTGLMAREFGGGRLAQAVAALAVALAPLPLFEGTEFQYTSFDYLWWVLAAYALLRVIAGSSPRWWLLVGVAFGLGVETKYAICFLIVGLLVGMAISSARAHFASRWFWLAVAITLAMALPNLLWQAHHGWISWHFLQSIHQRDVSQGRGSGYWTQQLWLCTNAATALVWLVGLVDLLRTPRLRVIGWMALLPILLLGFAHGRSYYAAGAYPPLLAAGAVVAESWLRRRTPVTRRVTLSVYFSALALVGALMIALLIPLAASGPLRAFALRNNGDLREEFGWPDLVATVAAIRDRLTPEQRSHLGIVTANYGEQGAIEILGPAAGLPAPIGNTNSAWLRGYPTPPPTVLIVVGLSRSTVDRRFTGCQLAGHNGNHDGVSNEESTSHPDIFLCGPPVRPWPEFWADFENFG